MMNDHTVPQEESVSVEEQQPVDNNEQIEEVTPSPKKNDNDTTHIQAGPDFFSEEEIAKRAKRRERFNIPEDTPKVVTAPKGMKLSEKGDEKENVDLNIPLRRDVINLYGSVFVNHKVVTKDLISYFKKYKPSRIEWISSLRCNVVFPDVFTAQMALLHMSQSLESSLTSITEQYDNWDDNATKTEGVSLPKKEELPLIAWRVANDSSKSATLFMRIANIKDVKPKYRHPSELPKEEYERQRLYMNVISNKGELVRKRRKRREEEKRRERAPKISLSEIRAKRKNMDQVEDDNDNIEKEDNNDTLVRKSITEQQQEDNDESILVREYANEKKQEDEESVLVRKSVVPVVDNQNTKPRLVIVKRRKL